jgi:hypothetical protein
MTTDQIKKLSFGQAICYTRRSAYDMVRNIGQPIDSRWAALSFFGASPRRVSNVYRGFANKPQGSMERPMSLLSGRTNDNPAVAREQNHRRRKNSERRRLELELLETRLLLAGDLLLVDQSPGYNYLHLQEYHPSGTLVDALDIPTPPSVRSGYNDARGLTVDQVGNIEFDNGGLTNKFSDADYLTTYSPATRTFTNQSLPSNFGNGVADSGGVAAFNNFVFASGYGITRFDLAGGSPTTFAQGVSFSDVTMGLNGLLYGLEPLWAGDNRIYEYDPTTLAPIANFEVQSSDTRRIAVDADGNIYEGTIYGKLVKVDPTGNMVLGNTSIPGGYIFSIAIDGNGQVAIGTRLGDVFLMNESLSSVTSFATNQWNVFITFGHYIPGSTGSITGSGSNVVATRGSSFTATVATFTATNLGAAVDDFEAGISWGDGQTSNGTVVRTAAGSFSVTGTHTYVSEGFYSIRAAVADAGGSQITTTSLAHIARTGPPPSGLFIAANTFTHSAEYYSHFVTGSYERFLGRAPDAPGLTSWVSAMQNGLTEERLVASLIGSPEYIVHHGGSAGADWIDAIYMNLLNRTPGTAEINGWTVALQNGMSLSDVGYSIVASPEREAIRIQAGYRELLGRNASAVEVGLWVALFEDHVYTNEDIGAALVASQEYFQKHYNDVPDWLYFAYRYLLARAPDQAAYALWLGFLGRE